MEFSTDLSEFSLPDEIRKAVEEILKERKAKEELLKIGTLKAMQGKGGQIKVGAEISGESLEYDPRYWHNVNPPEVYDISRYFDFDEDILYLLKKWLRIEEAKPKTVVEVGCKNGSFTEKLIGMASGVSEEILAVEPDDVFRRYAEEKFSSKVRFLKGFEDDIPLPDGLSDLTVCHILLSNLPDPFKVVSEMARITKAGGIVAAIEPSGGNISYYPAPELNELGGKVDRAFGKGVWNVRTKLIDYSKDLPRKNARYAEIFHSCGLAKVEEHGYIATFLLSDPRRDQQEILDWLRRRLLVHEEDWKRFRTFLRRGGLSDTLVQEYYQSMKAYLENLIENPQDISRTHELQTACRTVTIGAKA